MRLGTHLKPPLVLIALATQNTGSACPVPDQPREARVLSKGNRNIETPDALITNSQITLSFAVGIQEFTIPPTHQLGLISSRQQFRISQHQQTIRADPFETVPSDKPSCTLRVEANIPDYTP